MCDRRARDKSRSCPWSFFCTQTKAPGAAWLPRREVVRSRDSLAAASDAGYFRLGESVLLDCVIAYDFLLSWMSRLVPPPALLADM